VLEPYLRGRANASKESHAGGRGRVPSSRLDEAVGLARAIDLNVVSAGIIPIGTIRPATFIGTGKADEIAGLIKGHHAGIVVMDCALSPVQQRNLEKAWNAKVLDRTGLILEIFGRRARTREGALQVELAHLNYQKSRLVRSWTHLERQRGGFGFLGGPGETQIESDRRLIEERIARIETELAKVKRTRKLHRDSRRRVPYPVAALVGYTNAGKSTLFNRMTHASVLSTDMLFATLDPTLRAVALPKGLRIILSDTVGFIADLPTLLIAAFRATLEEVVEADIILHVRDVSGQDSEEQASDVKHVLGQLGIPAENATLEVWNKIDRLDDEVRVRLSNLAARRSAGHRPVLVSALTGEGIEQLAAEIETRLAQGRITRNFSCPIWTGSCRSWLRSARPTLDVHGTSHRISRASPPTQSRRPTKWQTRLRAEISMTCEKSWGTCCCRWSFTHAWRKSNERLHLPTWSGPSPKSCLDVIPTFSVMRRGSQRARWKAYGVKGPTVPWWLYAAARFA
jgi:GTPase